MVWGKTARLAKVVTLLAVALVLTAAGCAGSSGGGSLPSGAVVIDVRTAAEYASGHLEGATNIDVESSDFEARISQLDRAGTYDVYCRSGNRSAVAVKAMRNLGFSQVTDAGGIQDAARSTGLAVVTG